MKKIYSLFFILFVAITVKATNYNITISGLSYSPSTLNAVVGDVITISASGVHPLVEVAQSTWSSNGSTALSGGFGSQTSAFTFTLTTSGTIYYVCSNHIGSGMKGQIVVSAATNLNSIGKNFDVMNIFPNPIKSDMNIEIKSSISYKTTITLNSIKGEVLGYLIEDAQILPGVNAFKFTLPPTLSAGTYLISFTDGKKAVVSTIIKEE